MNFLAHLWLADRAGAEPAGAILGDVVRGPDLSQWPAAVADSIRLHRRIDAATDRHPLIVAARERYPDGHRRYAGIILDVLCDHLLVRQWSSLADEPLPVFARRSAQAVAAQGELFRRAGANAPDAARFASLLTRYGDADGVELTLQRIAGRLRRPAPLIAASRDWRRHAVGLAPDLPALMRDLARVT